MRHPFQRKKNRKSPIETPFQKELVARLEAFGNKGERVSGRQLSLLLGKSANHLSQMLNDGLVPSGQTILDMADVMVLSQAEADALIRAAMETKAAQRSRDNFWINQTTRMLRQAETEIQVYRSFLDQSGLIEAFEDFAQASQGEAGEEAGEEASEGATR